MQLRRASPYKPTAQIVFAGHEQGSTTYAYFNGLVGRLNSNGSLDASFAGSGVVTYHQPGGGYTSLNAVALQIDGKIVAAGADAGGPNAVFLRLNPDGTFDSSFGSGGVAILSSGTFTSTPVGANGVGIAGGGRVVGAGSVQLNGTDFRAGLWALSAAGAPDPSFGSGGIVEQQTGVEACALAVAPDGSLVTVGDSVSPFRPASTLPCSVNSTSSAFVARYIGYGPAPVARRPSVTTGARARSPMSPPRSPVRSTRMAPRAATSSTSERRRPTGQALRRGAPARARPRLA